MAARLDPARNLFWRAAARVADGPLPRHLAVADDRTWRGVNAAHEVAEPWEERAELLASACRGPLPQRGTCEKFNNPYYAASTGYVDDIIEPRESRPKIIASLSALRDKYAPAPPRKHGNIPV